jgi:uncharacterized iron-regulated membrane protein
MGIALDEIYLAVVRFDLDGAAHGAHTADTVTRACHHFLSFWVLFGRPIACLNGLGASFSSMLTQLFGCRIGLAFDRQPERGVQDPIHAI